MDEVDADSFKAQVTEELLAGKTFRFRNVNAPMALFILGGMFVAFSVLIAIFLDVLSNVGSFVGILGFAALFVILGAIALGAFVEVSPSQIVWKVLGKPRQIVFGELQAYALVHTVTTRGGSSYSCRVYLLSGKSRTITCSGLKKDRPLPRKMKCHEFVMSLMSAYLHQAGVPRYTGPL